MKLLFRSARDDRGCLVRLRRQYLEEVEIEVNEFDQGLVIAVAFKQLEEFESTVVLEIDTLGLSEHLEIERTENHVGLVERDT